MYANIRKILKISANNLDEINSYLEKGAVIISKDIVQTDEHSYETSYRFLFVILLFSLTYSHLLSFVSGCGIILLYFATYLVKKNLWIPLLIYLTLYKV